MIKLKQRLATGADHEWGSATGPVTGHGIGKRCSIAKSSTPATVCAHEIRITEAAYRRLSVRLTARPEIAAREAAEDGRTAGLGPLALQRIEDFLDRVAHDA